MGAEKPKGGDSKIQSNQRRKKTFPPMAKGKRHVKKWGLIFSPEKNSSNTKTGKIGSPGYLEGAGKGGGEFGGGE